MKYKKYIKRIKKYGNWCPDCGASLVSDPFDGVRCPNPNCNWSVWD